MSNQSEQYLGFSKDSLIQKNAIHTAREIAHQPKMWKETFNLIMSINQELEKFLGAVLENDDLDIVLTGAGSSAFIGQTLEPILRNELHRSVRAVATTDIVTYPQGYLSDKKPTLLISFARSGNSPESVAAVDIADKYCRQVYHIFITCNAEGKLALKPKSEKIFCIKLPPETNDKSLAMTSSFTSMLLAGYLISQLGNLNKLEPMIKDTVKAAENLIANFNDVFVKLAKTDFKRGIFLGTSHLQGIARESHLKLQELTDGKVVCQYDSYLGFRHGPKAVVNNETFVVFLTSFNQYIAQYESDLIKEMCERKDGVCRVFVGARKIDISGMSEYILIPELETLKDCFVSLLNIIPAQLLAFHKSLQVGLSPDAPSVSGNIARVVQGVNIYPYK